MTKPHRIGAPPPAAAATLPARAAEAMSGGRFKEAIDLFKQLARADPRPEWRDALADAYVGRARGLAAKGMFKEASLVLENTLTPAKLVREPALYAHCLVRDGQQPKAAAYLLHCVAQGALPAALEELTAALLIALPQLPAPAGPIPPDIARWRDLAAAAREALAAWTDGAPDETVERLLARVSLRSAFRPLRLALKCLVARPVDPGRARLLLESIPPGSPFFALREAVEAASRGGASLDADAWARLSSAQQAFVAESGGLSVAAGRAIGRLADAAASGPGGLFTWLLKQDDLPRADVKSACLNLLPQLPDRVAQFERSFGALSQPDRTRLSALTAEARGQWRAAETAWRDLAKWYREADGRREGGINGGLAAGVIYRHLCELAREHPELGGPAAAVDPAIGYLELSCEVDPDHLPSALARLAHHRSEARDARWHELADRAVARFGDDGQVLLAAMESAVAREAYKKAVGFARRLLKIDPINMAVRRQMIDLHVAHARKQARRKRLDLAARELVLAEEWDRPDAPSAALRVARGLVGLRGGEGETAMALLREAAALAGGGVAGWFRVVLEAELMRCAPAEISAAREELGRARRSPPTRAEVLGVATALGRPEAARDKRALTPLLAATHAWLEQGAAIGWTQDEFQILADVFARFDAYRLLRDYAAAARKREPTNPEWRFQEIVGRTRGNHRLMTIEEMDDIDDMVEAATERRDFHTRGRLVRYLDIDEVGRSGRAQDYDDLLDDLDELDPRELFDMLLDKMPKGAADDLRGKIGGMGREAGIELTMASLRESPLGEIMPEPLLRGLAENMVNKALSGAATRGRRT